VEVYMSIQWVGQRGRNDCWIAALAMITEQSYDAVLAEVVDQGSGADWFVSDSYLEAKGYAVARKFDSIPHLGERHREPWPPEPWAEVHICSVQASNGAGHAVVMLRDGSVFDPNSPTLRRLTEYPKVYAVAAVTKL
jgi:hypothetical protein